jgi:hypothetical protein
MRERNNVNPAAILYVFEHTISQRKWLPGEPISRVFLLVKGITGGYRQMHRWSIDNLLVELPLEERRPMRDVSVNRHVVTHS